MTKKGSNMTNIGSLLVDAAALMITGMGLFSILTYSSISFG